MTVLKPAIVRTLAELRSLTRNWRDAGETIGVVPTMGALHPGHLSLVARAIQQCDRVIVTLFVNPRQFNDPRDYEAYPKTEKQDQQRLTVLAPDLLYVPSPDQIYPDDFATTVTVSGITGPLEGEFRPGHFEGVATVVAKLFLQTSADYAFFGEKDYQQLLTVRRMAGDLDIPIEVVACPTVREPDGLAMSSRNTRLSEAGRAKAAALPKTLMEAADYIACGEPADQIIAEAITALENAGFKPVEYLEMRSVKDLSPLTEFTEPARLLIATHFDGVRLIDNVPVERLSAEDE
jgi:pantoate--beta-alanine ligase